MMKLHNQSLSPVKFAGSKAALTALAMIVMGASPAFAFCEPPGVATGAASAAVGVHTTALATQYIALTGTSEVTLHTALQTPVSIAMDNMQSKVFDRMNLFWRDWEEAWKGMTAQLSAGTIDQTRQLASIGDAKIKGGPVLKTQKEEYQAKKIYQPTEQSCTFDTAARHTGAASRRSKAVSSALATDLTRLGGNKKGTAGAQGPAPLQKSRWQTYVANFCDPNSNAKDPGCKAPGAAMGADIMPSKTIFMRDTIDLKDEKTRTSVQELVFNVTNYQVLEPMKQDVLEKPAGREQRSENRSYLTQMDGVAGMVNAIVAERAPGPKAEDIQALRMKMGVPACADGDAGAIACASSTPSEREIRQARIEELRDPNYYVSLGSGDSETLKKEVLLRALNLSMLFNIIEKTEKISNNWAIETNNMVKARKPTGSTNQFMNIKK